MNGPKSDHDLLIEINRDMVWLKDELLRHEKDDASNFSSFNERLVLSSRDNDRKIDKAHIRMDGFNGKILWICITGVLAIVALTLSVVQAGQ